ncbi:MAG TPA: two-component system response regulator [Deltaproteobacteria bacterium]|nr:MAG: hypothetical protein A2Z79_03705 [Deltaproteobacteria bacterium GWA2_55_82]OGQ63651.1 MAG: hypothetical protein A3I81_02805 [Deltaproteobacteria bacterium RIFCSPLOWO2_02_FULL_55_12]OIJ74489.1 MAG: hypothetical protein A2V21_309605 [Deltaproteobacteria bacterium GWC2_55_46]HBG47147.1 two-component system response regulator [Deltaproteobacteria bacterium]HCY10792.1 two-component system response regulator [Deltaproteobacteria bacterium]
MSETLQTIAKGQSKKARILIADDDTFYLRIFSDLISELGYESISAVNGLEALEKARTHRPDVLLIDVVMPGMDGFEVTKRLKEDPATMYIPVVIVTSLSDRNSKIRGLQSGADELLSKPVDETEFRVRLRNLLKVKRYEDFLVEHGRRLENEVEDKSVQLERAFDKIRKGYIETVFRLTLAAEQRDKETGSHIKRISLYSQMMARYLRLPEEEVETIFFASPMHDVGKIGIPDSILLKPGPLTPEEFEIMKTHTTIGAEILKDADSGILAAARDIALTHHERWNGKGYPRGLKGTEIPMSGRIVNMVDIYDALRSSRPYKESFDHDTACRIIFENPDNYDPVILAAFSDCSKEFRRLYDENHEETEPQNSRPAMM